MSKNKVIPNGWVVSNFGDKSKYDIIGSGINKFEGLKKYYSTASIEEDKVVYVEELITYQNRPDRANMQPVENSIWFAKMKNTRKFICPNEELIKNAIFSTGFCGIKTSKVDCSFLMQVLKSEDFNRIKDNLSEGTTQIAINNERIKIIPFLLPTSLAEQKQIADILSTADKAIEDTQALIDKYKKMKIGLMHDLLKPQKNWRYVLLEEVCKIVTGPFGSSLHEKDYTQTGTPIVNPQNIIDNKVFAINECLVSDETVERLKKYKMKAGDIVIARRGEMGRCAIIEKEQEGWLCGTGSFFIISNPKKIYAYFLQMLLSSEETKLKLQNNSIGSTMCNLNQGILYNLAFQIPDLNEQKRIATIILNADTHINNLEKSLSKLRKQKIGLMNDLLSGKIRTIK